MTAISNELSIPRSMREERIVPKTRLLSEHLRPQSLDDLSLPKAKIESLKRMVASKKVQNLLFYGSPGIGKTSTARILCDELDADTYSVAGSDLNKSNQLENVDSFCRICSLFTAIKVCFIDEADFMSSKVQSSLRITIESSSDLVRFVMTANNISKISKALQSRFTCINFDVLPKDRTEVIEKLIFNYRSKLRDLNYIYDKDRLREIVYRNYPDMRSIANQFEFEFERGEQAA